ncbi:KilA-N domain-containing protein [Burkholderia gladioli]|uniref:KilA-N domain-containing protein n=1 Tax=Burkholderia gladioli TaxID=28095 RepID=UPI001ABA0B9B|nr:KilA-N domain-containing protein [Burkholderia gladioli]
MRNDSTSTRSIIEIGEIVIHADEHGRFSLNDLHRAAGGERKHGPSLWMENRQTKELVSALAQEMIDAGNPVSIIRGGVEQGTYVCTELVYAYAAWISAAFYLKVIRVFHAVATGAIRAPRPAVSDKVQAELAIMECYTRLLRPAPSSQVAMLTKVAEQNSLDPRFLPTYTIDAPTGVDGSSLATAPLTKLLRDFSIGITAHAYNLLLCDMGIIEERVRPSTSRSAVGGVKRFWSITDDGLIYGKNITSPSNPRETQPHWYVTKFAQLHALVKNHRGVKAQTPPDGQTHPLSNCNQST